MTKCSLEQVKQFKLTSKEYNGLWPEWRYTLVGNIVKEHEYGENKEIVSGTKKYKGGTKVYLAPIQWGDGYEYVVTIGKIRYAFRYIETIVNCKYIENFRCKKVYDSKIIKKMNLSKYRWWGISDDVQEEIKKLADSLNEEEKAEKEISIPEEIIDKQEEVIKEDIDPIIKIDVNYHHVSKLKVATELQEEGLEFITFDYTEQLVIDRSTETLNHIRNIGSGCKITNTYYIQDGIDELLDGFKLADFEEIQVNYDDVVYDALDKKEYSITIKTSAGKEYIIHGTYDKYGLPTYWDEFINHILDFLSFYGIGEIFDRSIYNKTIRRESDLIFCNVEFQDGYKTYCYLADTDDYGEGDYVIVPVGNENCETVARIDSIEYHSKDEAPYPLDKIKHIIRKCEE